MLPSTPQHRLALVAVLGLLAAGCGSSESAPPAGPPPIAPPAGDLLGSGNFAPYDPTHWQLTSVGDATAEAVPCDDFDGDCVVVHGSDYGNEPYATQLAYWNSDTSSARIVSLTPGAYKLYARVRASTGGTSVQVVMQDSSYRVLQELAIAPTRSADNYQSDTLVLENPADVTFKVNLGGAGNAGAKFYIDDLYLVRLGAAAAPPTFSPDPGRYDSAQSVTLATTTPGASIYYSLSSGSSDPGDPGDPSILYTGPIALPQPADPGASTIYRINTKATGDGLTDSRVVSAQYTIENPTGDWALRVEGTSATANGETAVSIQFNMATTDFTPETYTASFDMYIPSTSTLPNPALQTQYPNAAFSPMYFNTYSPFPTDTWFTRTYTLTKANRAWPQATDAAPLLSDSNKFRIVFQTASASQSVLFYVKNIRVTNGTNTPLNIVFTQTTDLSTLGIFQARGAFTYALARR
jgi:hypothetical protein